MDKDSLIYSLSRVLEEARASNKIEIIETLQPLISDYEEVIGKGLGSNVCRDVVPYKSMHWENYLKVRLLATDNIEQQRNRFHRFSDEEAFSILEDRYIYRMNHDALVDKYNCGRQTIIDIVKRRRYQWISVDKITAITGISEEAMKSKRFNF